MQRGSDKAYPVFLLIALLVFVLGLATLILTHRSATSQGVTSTSSQIASNLGSAGSTMQTQVSATTSSSSDIID